MSYWNMKGCGLLESSSSSTAAGPVALDFSDWSLNEGSVSGLVTAYDEDSIDVASLTADSFSAMSRLGGDDTAPQLLPGKKVDVWLERINFGATDKVGLAIGIYASNSANGAAGPFETASSQERLGITNGSLSALAEPNAHAVSFTAELDVNGKLCSWKADFYNMTSGEPVYVDSANGTMNVDPGLDVYLAVWVRHGAAAGTGVIEYSGSRYDSDIAQVAS